MRKQVISAALCAMLLFGAGGCKEEGSAGKLEVWSYTAAERILRDKDYAASFKRAGGWISSPAKTRRRADSLF